MSDGHIERILREAGVPDLLEVLSERLAGTDLQSLLLEVYRRRGNRLSPAEVLSRFERDRFCRPAGTGPAALADLERLAWSLLPDGYEALELSPVCPLGTVSTVAMVDQNNVLSTVRNTEVVADSTNVLAMECALRRRAMLATPERRAQPVRLASSHRQLRAQAFDSPSAAAHFHLLAVAAAGRDRGSMTFEASCFRQQIGYFVRLVADARPDWGIRVAFTDLCGREDLWRQEVLDAIVGDFPDVVVAMDPARSAGRGYYVDGCFKLFAVDPPGREVELADGGCTSWTRQLLSDHKERLVIAGLGVERLLG